MTSLFFVLLALVENASAAVRPVTFAGSSLTAPAIPAATVLFGVSNPLLGLPTSAPSLASPPAAALAAPSASPRSSGAKAAAPAVRTASNGRFKANGPRWRELLEEARRTTDASARRILAMRKAVKMLREYANTDTKTIADYSGVPRRVERLDASGHVFRHWVRDAKDFETILRQGALRVGTIPYVEWIGTSHAYIKSTYVDLEGAFFTSPAHSSEEPRVMNEALPHYVDFRIPEGVSALRLDGDDVLMIPAPRGTYIPIEIVGSSR